jgi:protein PhnA
MYVCPECAHEWSRDAAAAPADQGRVVKDLKIKGSSQVLKVGTKVKGIRLVDGDHDIDCKVDGIGPMQLKSEFVKKA